MRQAEFAFGVVAVLAVVTYKSVKLGVTTVATAIKTKAARESR